MFCQVARNPPRGGAASNTCPIVPISFVASAKQPPIFLIPKDKRVSGISSSRESIRGQHPCFSQQHPVSPNSELTISRHLTTVALVPISSLRDRWSGVLSFDHGVFQRTLRPGVPSTLQILTTAQCGSMHGGRPGREDFSKHRNRNV
jgi:hypothetical protein